MRFRCHLRTIRGERSLKTIAVECGVNQGDLSRIENGLQLPKDKDIPALVQAYGARVVDWYPPEVLWAIESDDDQILDIRARLRTTLLPVADDRPR